MPRNTRVLDAGMGTVCHIRTGDRGRLNNILGMGFVSTAARKWRRNKLGTVCRDLSTGMGMKRKTQDDAGGVVTGRRVSVFSSIFLVIWLLNIRFFPEAGGKFLGISGSGLGIGFWFLEISVRTNERGKMC